jgi:hypothetical protein
LSIRSISLVSPVIIDVSGSSSWVGIGSLYAAQDRLGSRQVLALRNDCFFDWFQARKQ